MNKIVIGSVTLVALAVAGPTLADPKLKQPQNALPPAVTSWTGFYAGLGLGFRASHTDVTTTSESFAGVPRSLANAITSQPFDGTALRASPFVGFNWQFAPRWIAGIEGEFGFASQTTTLTGFPFTPAFGNTLNPLDSLTVKTKWDASLRGRLGFLLTPATMAYATGGAAWQHYDVTSTCASPICEVTPGANGFTPAVVTNSITKMGWTIGGGFEMALQEHWLARAEYRYADFGAPSFIIARSSIKPLFNPSIDTFDVRMRTHTVNFGLAYKFN